MANYEVGDVFIWDTSWPGHVGMVYSSGGSSGSKCAKIIHATNKTDFAVEPIQTEFKPGKFKYLTDGASVFRPPWGECKDTDGRKAALISSADKIRSYAKYGVYRATRLYLGSSEYGKGARERLGKYRLRSSKGSTGDKVVTKITCAESVILCYQLAFAEGMVPFFISLDAAHTMPRTLGLWLSSRWDKVKSTTHKY